MDHGSLVPNSAFRYSSMDLDFADGETMNQLGFLEKEHSISTVVYDPSGYFPYMGSGHWSINSYHQLCEEEMENFAESPPLLSPEMDGNLDKTTTSLLQSENFADEGSELVKTWWIDPSCSVKERLKLAMGHLKEFVEERDVLIQIWVPVEIEGKSMLTTIDQPYFLSQNCEFLASYRNISKSFYFSAEEDSRESAGLPGRVFLAKFPEWTPDVRFFRNDECPRKSYAEMYNISGCLATPVFDQGTGTCLAVVEVVTTKQKISHHLELEIVYRALEAVDLRSAQDFFLHGLEFRDEFYKVSAVEISEVLQAVGEAQRLPLALTWAPCAQQDKGGYQEFTEKHSACLSTVDSACFVDDGEFLEFYQACSEQFLFLDQGIVGKAFSTGEQCFASDVTSFTKTNYPLSHHARMFNLRAAVAIPLQSKFTGSVEFILELFLPRDCQDIEEQKRMCNLLSVVIKESCKSFQVIMDEELEKEINWHSIASDARILKEGTQKFVSSPLRKPSPEESSWIPHIMEAQNKGKCVCISWERLKEEPEEEFKLTSHWDTNDLPLGIGSWIDWRGSLSSGKAGKKRQTKAEKTVSLQVLQQYFAGSLKDAAKSVGVCPTTLKRICRQHGITRWPSRKIKKVSHSLKKIQVLVDSIQGAKGLIQLSSPSFTGNDPFTLFKKRDDCKDLKPQPMTGLLIPESANSKSQSSSSSQNSGPSICHSSAARQLADSADGLSSGHALRVEDPILVLKRTCSEAELHSRNPQETMPISGPKKRKTLDEHQSPKAPPTLQNTSDWQTSQAGNAYRVKATFGEEKIRLSLQPNLSFEDLKQEIAKRFKIDGFEGIDLKYLDNDHEAVLLTCDADLDECRDIFRLSQNQTIKISLHQASQLNRASALTL